ncbi:DOPA-like domain-containing protein [Ephemerocybe angulata]|uniref:DOPA-like domain-containing protein n=1 Tax=Ephemerocybe angulata TaxID=980116 RepID=A0A8H6IA46_9AGAR|nr:DOPA-like domain-containing protein [Tulosesus angulatus]
MSNNSYSANFPYASPLAVYDPETLKQNPLDSEARNADGKSLVNPPTGKLSTVYDEFPEGFVKTNNGFDFHIYYMPGNPDEALFAKELHERIRREFPELRIYRFWDKAIGPHPTAMFEVNVFTPHQTGAFFSWLALNRGPLSVLIHPNTSDPLKDHTELATWMGRPWPLNITPLSMELRGTGAHAAAAAPGAASGAN